MCRLTKGWRKLKCAQIKIGGFMKLFISTVKPLVIEVAIFAAAICMLPKHAVAQNYTTDGQMLSDTVAVSVIPPVDSSFVGVSVFDLLTRGSAADNSVENGGSGRTGLNGKVVLHQDIAEHRIELGGDKIRLNAIHRLYATGILRHQCSN